jgi:putative transcriptional regulator
MSSILYKGLSLSVDNKVKVLRITNGDLTQQDLADKVGCSRQTIHSIESGKFVPSVELALKISKVLNCKVEDLFQLESSK